MSLITKIQIPELKEEILKLHVKGMSPLVVNRYDGRDLEEGSPKEERNPQEEFERSVHWLDREKGTSGFPSRGFKAAAVTAGQILKKKDYQRAKVRAAFFIPEEIVPIRGTPELFENVVRQKKVPTKRYRGRYWPWEADIELYFAEGILTLEQIIQLFTVGGSRVGIGEDRPERGGNWGRFEVTLAERYSK